MRVEVRCPAKINLFLSVAKPDGHGYHPIRTIFEAVDLCDTVVLDDEAEPGFYCDSAEVPSENTVTKAHRLVSEFAKVPPLRIELAKRIPSEAGLGGGSSDAAGFLRTIHRFLPAPIPKDQLLDIAIAIGMDTAYFLTGGRARGTGYGEIIEPLPDPDPQWYVLAKPDVGNPSGATYKLLDELNYPWLDFPTDGSLYNDFERIASCESLDLVEALQIHGCTAAGLSGSGSAVFGLAPDEEVACEIAEGLRSQTVQTWAASNLSRKDSTSVT